MREVTALLYPPHLTSGPNVGMYWNLISLIYSGRLFRSINPVYLSHGPCSSSEKIKLGMMNYLFDEFFL